MPSERPSGTPSLLATSDLHVSHQGNRAVIEGIQPHADGDWLIVAGDVADTVADIHSVLKLMRDRFEKVIWVPGNHELWNTPHDPVNLDGQARYERLVQMCGRLDVLTPEDPFPVWDDGEEKLVVAPLFTLYDYSWRPDGMTLPQALEHARKTKVVCTDEFFLHPAPFETRQEWCHERVRISAARLDAVPKDLRTVLVSHWPLHRGPTTILTWPHFAMWCGTELTESWHLRYRAAVAVYGHLHIPLTLDYDGVRFEEVSLGYPREWRSRRPSPPDPLRRIVPADPGRRPMNHLMMRAAGAAKRAASTVRRVLPD